MEVSMNTELQKWSLTVWKPFLCKRERRMPNAARRWPASERLVDEKGKRALQFEETCGSGRAPDSRLTSIMLRSCVEIEVSIGRSWE
jgi:hypothetical protein